MPARAPRTSRATPRLAATVAFLSIATAGLVACDRDRAGDAATFCGRVADNIEALRAEPATEAEVESLIELWIDIGEDAPLAIEPDWDAYIDSYLRAAWTSDDEEEILASVFAGERSAVAIATWLQDNCGVEWGPVTTIVAHDEPDTSVSGTAPTG